MTSRFVYRPDIDGLRALAVFAVVTFHAFPGFLPGGFTGVDIFFVISGFLITSIIASQMTDGQFRIFEFYSKRVKRIFPSLLVVLLFCLILGWINLLPVDFAQLGKHVAAGASFSSNFLLWSEVGYFDHLSDVKPLLHLWSLGIEEQFYLGWPIVLLICFRFKFNLRLASALIGIFSFMLGIWLLQHSPVAAFYSPIGRFWEFSLGTTYALVQLNRFPDTNRSFKNFASLAGLALVIYALVFVKSTQSFPGFLAIIPTFGAFLLIYSGTDSFVNKYLLSKRLAVAIGLISYPLYLWHWIFLSFININSFLFSPREQILLRICSIPVSLFFSFLCFRFVEKPARSNRSRNIVFSLLAGMLALGILGYSVYKLQGIPSRFPAEIRELTEPINFDFEKQSRFGICHFDTRYKNNQAQILSADCIEKKRPLLLIWGDSYAAALYPGLKALQSKIQFGIFQATACGTPPLLNIKDGNSCVNADQMNTWNKLVLDAVQKSKPEIIILHCFWPAHGTKEELLEQFAKMKSRIAELSPQSKIVIIGSPPTWGSWEEGLPKLLYNFWKLDPSHEIKPLFMSLGLVDDFENKFFSREVPKLGITYISAHDVLCRNDGKCLTHVGPKATDIIAIDRGHFSSAGAIYFINRISDQIFRNVDFSGK